MLFVLVEVVQRIELMAEVICQHEACFEKCVLCRVQTLGMTCQEFWQCNNVMNMREPVQFLA